MNKVNSTLMALEGALGPLMSLISRAKGGGCFLMADGSSLPAQHPFLLADGVRGGKAAALRFVVDGVQWCWGFPGWEKHADSLDLLGFEGRTGISDEFLSVAGFDREDVRVEVGFLERAGHVGFTVPAIHQS
jgi:hypothetical protein